MSPAPYPRMHGLSHVTGGPDPVPGLLPAPGSLYIEQITGHPALIHYWRMGATGNQPDLAPLYEPVDLVHIDADGTGTLVPGTFNVEGALGGSQDDGAWQSNLGGCYFSGGARGDYFEVTEPARSDFSDNVAFSIECWLWPAESVTPHHGGVVVAPSGWSLTFRSGGEISLTWPTGNAGLSPALELEAWTHVVVTHDGATTRYYLNGGLAHENAGAVAAGSSTAVRVGLSVTTADCFFPGRIDEVALYLAALSGGEILAHYNAGVSEGGSLPGEVVTVDEDGTVSWQPPGVEVEHGGGEPDESVRTGPGSGSLDGLASPSGWEYVSHRETLVLYDSTVARFDVPSRKWVRVPFNAVRIQRKWQTETEAEGGSFKNAWLPDDRGVTADAKNGVLRITEDMLFEFPGGPVAAYPLPGQQYLDGWFSIEYPVLDWTELPASDPPTPDGYVRAARFVNTRTGHVVGTPAGRAFRQWYFAEEGAGEGSVAVDYPADNPYPVYPHWAARPMVKPLPYPQMSPTDSLVYYKNEVGTASFGPDHTLSVFLTSAVAGDTFVLQAWQDSPWPLRFSTDHFPNYGGFALLGQTPWLNRPRLSLEYYYDPETIDHTTGRLL